MKAVKKVFSIILIIVMLTVNFYIPKVHAKTLRDLKSELSQKEAEYNANNEKRELTEREISEAKANMSAISKEISVTHDEMIKLNEEIDNLNIEIKEKEVEIKKIMNYYQLSNGEETYLEYIFNATDYTDFIYRMAIAEQLSSYNDRLIKEYQQKIKENSQKTKELDSKTKSLQSKQAELEVELKKLREQLSSIQETSISVEDEIKILREYVDTYQNKYKCGLDEDISTCGRDKLPPGTAFFRPIDSGVITANFGWYSPWGEFIGHDGTDFGGMAHGSNVYAIADGKVAGTIYRGNCGGNMVFVHHYVKGQTYTSLYAHLASINVSVGDVVTPNSVVGYVGGNPYIETWDACSTGTHVHLQVAYGLYLEDYYSWSTFTSKSFDSRLIVNMPSLGTWISNREIKY